MVLGKLLDLEIEAVSVYDPYFHRRVFKWLVGVLPEDAGKNLDLKNRKCFMMK